VAAVTLRPRSQLVYHLCAGIVRISKMEKAPLVAGTIRKIGGLSIAMLLGKLE
jgi:hydrogenase maturation factor HypE